MTQQDDQISETLSIAGSGLIATGIAACASRTPGHRLWARSAASAERAARNVAKACERLGEMYKPAHITITTELRELGEGTYFIEAISEELAAKCDVLAELGHIADENAVIASTTSSLSIQVLAIASTHPDRFAGFHVFSPVPRMNLVEIAFLPEALESTRERTFRLCRSLDKTPVEAPPETGLYSK